MVLVKQRRVNKAAVGGLNRRHHYSCRHIPVLSQPDSRESRNHYRIQTTAPTAARVVWCEKPPANSYYSCTMHSTRSSAGTSYYYTGTFNMYLPPRSGTVCILLFKNSSTAVLYRYSTQQLEFLRGTCT